MRARRLGALELEEAARLLRAGECVAVPTETVYGLAASIDRPDALARVFEVKERPHSDPLIVHLAARYADPGKLDELGIVARAAIGSNALRRIERLWRAFAPGPLTIVLPRGPRIHDLVTGGGDTVGIRFTAHPLTARLLEEHELALAAPSANRFGRISPTCAADVDAELGERIAAILDGGPCRIGIESTVLRVTEDGIEWLRPGAVTREQVLEVAGVLPRDVAGAANASPGRLESHYAPVTPLELLPGPALSRGALERLASTPGRIGLLTFGTQAPRDPRIEVIDLGRELDAAAARLFAAMRALDAAGVERIFAEPVPSSAGIGAALMDRLRRAAARQP